ncbi:hypothetical protein [Novispirillum itersonii]|uniref:hypothetical protein n=1 Tax=Novispirillum itersonii TaxID=189 RepID=UPI0003673875|nr:hypothetical protein [Novispirillum itersonii]
MALTRQDIVRKVLAEYTRKATSSPEAAKKTLVREGIYRPDGALTFEYGGKRSRAAVLIVKKMHVAEQHTGVRKAGKQRRRHSRYFPGGIQFSAAEEA